MSSVMSATSAASTAACVPASLIAIDPEPGSHPLANRGIVAGQHDDLRDVGGLEASDRYLRVGTDSVGDMDDAQCLPTGRDIDARPSVASCGRGHGDPVIRQERGVPDQDGPAVELGPDAAAPDHLEARRLGNLELVLLRPSYHCLGEWMT